MCLLVVHEAGFCLDDKQIRAAWENNPDGGGFSHFAPITDKDSPDYGKETIRTFRSMDLKAFMGAYHSAIKRYPNSPFIVHFRYGTSGAMDLTNVHPFVVGEPNGAATTVMAHNGVLPIRENAEDNWSDTRTFVEWWLPEMPEGWLDNFVLRQMCEEFIRNSKLAFLTTDPALKQEYYILNEDAGHWGTDMQSGVWFSNGSYCTTPKYGRTGSKYMSAAAIAALNARSKGSTTGASTTPTAMGPKSKSAEDSAKVFSEGSVYSGLGMYLDEEDDEVCAWCGNDIENGDCATCEWCYTCDASFDPALSANHDYACDCWRANDNDTYAYNAREDRAMALEGE